MGRRRAMLGVDSSIGGIRVKTNNAALNLYNGTSNDYFSDNTRFISEFVDVGEIGHSIIFGYQATSHADERDPIREFNDKNRTSVEWWTVSQNPIQRTISSTIGRYLLATVNKSLASKYFIYDVTTQRYLLKGNDVEGTP